MGDRRRLGGGSSGLLLPDVVDGGGARTASDGGVRLLDVPLGVSGFLTASCLLRRPTGLLCGSGLSGNRSCLLLNADLESGGGLVGSLRVLNLDLLELPVGVGGGLDCRSVGDRLVGAEVGNGGEVGVGRSLVGVGGGQCHAKHRSNGHGCCHAAAGGGIQSAEGDLAVERMASGHLGFLLNVSSFNSRPCEPRIVCPRKTITGRLPIVTFR